MPSTTTVLSAYASFAGSMMFVRSIANEFIPHQLQSYISSTLRYIFNPVSSRLTFVIEEFDGLSRNQVYEASEIFLRTKITPSIERLKISKAPREKNFSVTIEKGQEIIDFFEGIQLRWRFVCAEAQKSNIQDPYQPHIRSEQKSFELSFHKKHKEKILESYLPYVLKKSKELKEENKVLKLHTYGSFYGDNAGGSGVWGSINLEHPATFDTLAMDPELKKELMEDLERFVKRKEFYKKVGKAWKRGYLLYGPPGTGKSSLIAAMANYLNFDIYDLELAVLQSNSELRSLLVATNNRSILVIEDIDCSVELQDRGYPVGGYHAPDPKLTLSGLLNFIDGLWSSCGDERIIVFTTNHKDKLDPALLRPGRMDMHIPMSYCTPKGFRLLASNYLSIDNHHQLFGEIEELIQESQITPAEVAEELMKSDDADTSLDGLIKFLKRKKMEGNEVKDDDDKETTNQQSKRQKFEGEEEKRPRRTYRGRGRGLRLRGTGISAKFEEVDANAVVLDIANEVLPVASGKFEVAGSRGPISGPKEADFVLKRSKGVHGFFGASSLERLPVEQAITSTIKEYKLTLLS
ncbi:AAA+ ATPase domain [Macleaya cordata]|uniref:AAA+ ATPase domain n=1 Tax=Macleaya cordata TaxID=56857 RepID=A0A200R7T3_MACCD|nr:AAA+ ATPase domain [Macleaya cordata]